MRIVFIVLGLIIMFASLWGNAWLFVNLPEYAFAALMSGLLGIMCGGAMAASAVTTENIE